MYFYTYIYANRAWQALGVSSSFNLGGGPAVCRTPSVTQHTSHATHATCMTLDIWAQASMFEHSQWTHFENPPTRTHANRNQVVALITQVTGATGACAMGGCQHPCYPGPRPSKRARWCRPGFLAICIRWSSIRFKFLD